MNKLDVIERPRLRADIPSFRPGDQIKVFVKVREGQRTRDQVFEGVVIARRGGGLRESFTVRKISFGVGVERTFPIHAPLISKIEVVRHGRVRRAKLYYLRELSGRKAKINERRTRIPSAVIVAPAEEQPLAPEDLAPPEVVAEAEVAETVDETVEQPAADTVAEPQADAEPKVTSAADAAAE